MGRVLDYLGTIRGEWTPCSIDPREGQLLYAMVRNQVPHRMIEVGRSSGYSTLWLAAAIEDNGVGCLVSIDKVTSPFCESVAQERFEQSGANQYVRSLKMTSLEAAYEKVFDHYGFHGKYDFLFLDGAHHPLAVEADLKAWLPSMSPYGVMVVHDTIKFMEDEIANRQRGDDKESFGRAWPGTVIRQFLIEGRMKGFLPMTLETSHGMTVIRREGAL